MNDLVWRVEVRTFPADKQAPPHPELGEEWQITRKDNGELARFKTEYAAGQARDILSASQPHALFRVRGVAFDRKVRKHTI